MIPRWRRWRGCAKVLVADLAQPKLDIIGAYPGIETVNIRTTTPRSPGDRRGHR